MASITKWSIVIVRPTQGQHKQQRCASFRVQWLIPGEKVWMPFHFLLRSLGSDTAGGLRRHDQ